jgi:hypothetical protein
VLGKLQRELLPYHPSGPQDAYVDALHPQILFQPWRRLSPLDAILHARRHLPGI